MKQSKGDGVRGQGCRQKAPWAGGSRAPSAARWSPRPRQRAAQEGGAGNGSQRHPTLRQAFPPPPAPEVPGPAEPTGSPLTASAAGPTRSRKGSAGRGRPLTRLGRPSAAPRFPETSLAARVVAGTLGAWLGLPRPEAPSAFFKWMARGSTVCFLLKKVRENKRRRKLPKDDFASV